MLSLTQKINLRLLREGIITEDNETEQDVSTKFIHKNDTDRRAMLQAMTNTGHSVSSLADAADVEPSMVSRLLRKPTTGDPSESARNPSISTAAKIGSALNTSVEALFPDIFDAEKSTGRGRGKNKKKSRKTIQTRSDKKYEDGE
jgi:transcriptional regulator with XRE-family HTH domain